eukprot:scaffold13695_cov105-Skeletonema_marinoi.AAC.7
MPPIHNPPEERLPYYERDRLIRFGRPGVKIEMPSFLVDGRVRSENVWSTMHYAVSTTLTHTQDATKEAEVPTSTSCVRKCSSDEHYTGSRALIHICLCYCVYSLISSAASHLGRWAVQRRTLSEGCQRPGL